LMTDYLLQVLHLCQARYDNDYPASSSFNVVHLQSTVDLRQSKRLTQFVTRPNSTKDEVIE
jgi:hypothetical protein